MADYTEILAKTDFFADAPYDALERIAASGTEQHLVRGDVLFSAGDPPEAIYLVLQGRIAIAIANELDRRESVVALDGGRRPDRRAGDARQRPPLGDGEGDRAQPRAHRAVRAGARALRAEPSTTVERHAAARATFAGGRRGDRRLGVPRRHGSHRQASARAQRRRRRVRPAGDAGGIGRHGRSVAANASTRRSPASSASAGSSSATATTASPSATASTSAPAESASSQPASQSLARANASAASSGRWAGRSGACANPCSASGYCTTWAPVAISSSTSGGGVYVSSDADDRQHPVRIAGREMLERLTVARALPRLRHLDHPVERRDAGEAIRARRLEAVHPAHAETHQPDPATAGGIGTLEQIAQVVVVVELGRRLRSGARRRARGHGPGTARRHRWSSPTARRVGRPCRRRAAATRRCRG